MVKFTRIGLFAKKHDDKVSSTVQAVYARLGAQATEVLVHKSAAAYLSDVDAVSSNVIGEKCAAAVVVGGDGSLLGAARKLAGYPVSLVGINLGRLGFLVDVSPGDELAQLDAILDGKYKQESRFLLQTQVIRKEEICFEDKALNDVVLRIKDVVRMIEFETYVDGRFVNLQRADGMIAASPTGSTAYALSAGGPVLHPSLQAIVLLAICSHTFSNRPIVIGNDSVVELRVCDQNPETAHLVCDGQVNFDVYPGDRILIKRNPETITLLHPEDYDYFTLLREKLHWS